MFKLRDGEGRGRWIIEKKLEPKENKMIKEINLATDFINDRLIVMKINEVIRFINEHEKNKAEMRKLVASGVECIVIPDSDLHHYTGQNTPSEAIG